MISWPDSVRAEVARWLSHDVAPNGAPGEKKAKESNSAQDRTAPNEAPKPNGLDRHPPRTAPSTGRGAPTSSRAKAPPNNVFNRKTIELKVLEALRERPNQTAGALARAVGGAHTTVARELKELASRGTVTKDSAGHWRLVAELAGAEPDPTMALPSN